MNYDEAMAFIHKTQNFGSRLGLERMRELCALLGDPQERLKFIHVAGTNGKGSTVTMIACALEDAGYTVGKYTSPYVYDFRERIEVNGAMIGKDELAALTERVAAACGKMEDHPTEFETVTAIAFLYYLERKCDFVVLEVGLGGRLDATNVISAPVCSVICSISLDHTHILGDTVEKIAAEKAGIIKEGRPCVAYPANPPEVIRVFERVCKERGSELIIPQSGGVSANTDGTFSFTRDGVRFTPSLKGRHQAYNAMTALEALKCAGTDEKYAQSGIARAALHGRYETICEKPLTIVDAGHNPSGVDSLLKTLKSDRRVKSPTLIFGMLADKDYAYAIRALADVAARMVCVTPDSPRALPAEKAAEVASMFCGDVTAFEDTEDAVREALRGLGGSTLVICGSFYVIDKTVKELERQLDKKLI